MGDWLVVWGAAQAAGLVVKPILEEFAKDTVKDFAKATEKSTTWGLITRLPDRFHSS